MEKTLSDELRLEKTAIKAFRQHWKKIVRDIEEGRKNYINELYPCFEADTAARQRILARRFYGIEHARKMASLSKEAIKENLSCFLPKGIEYAVKENTDEPKEQEAFMRTLVRCEYVIFRSNQGSPFDLFDEDTEDLWVAEYPARVAYDDWYEGSIGAGNTCQTSILMKSTGEAFTKREVEWLKRSIRRNIDGNDRSALWWFGCEPLEVNKIWVKIYDYSIDRSLYMEDFLNELDNLNREQLREFIRQVLDRLHEACQGEKIIDKLNVFNGYNSMKLKKLFGITCSFFWENWEADILSDFDVRAAEDTMNRISGREERSYHTGINL